MIGSLSGVSPLGQNVQMSQHNPSPGERPTGNTATRVKGDIRHWRLISRGIQKSASDDNIMRWDHKSLRRWMFYLGQVGLAASQRRVRAESITAYLCCQVDDDRIFCSLSVILETDHNAGRRQQKRGAEGGACFWTQLSWLRCKNVLNKTYLVDFCWQNYEVCFFHLI